MAEDDAVRIAVDVITLVIVIDIVDVRDGEADDVVLTVGQGVAVALRDDVVLTEADVVTENERPVVGDMEGEAVPVDDDDCNAE